jgi:hypothetical protein
MARRFTFQNTMSNQNEEWQPIETAPRDGTEILVWNGRYQLTATWSGEPSGYWQLLEAGEFAASNRIDDEPTLWKPLGPDPDPVVGL